MRITSLMVLLMYFSVVSAHLFFAPKFQYKQLTGKACSEKNNTQLIYTLIRTNRCMVNDNKVADALAKQFPGFFISLISGGSLPVVEVKVVNNNFSPVQISPDRHFSYLYNRVLRI
jgi:hypothetical protein